MKRQALSLLLALATNPAFAGAPQSSKVDEGANFLPKLLVHCPKTLKAAFPKDAETSSIERTITTDPPFTSWYTIRIVKNKKAANEYKGVELHALRVTYNPGIGWGQPDRKPRVGCEIVKYNDL